MLRLKKVKPAPTKTTTKSLSEQLSNPIRPVEEVLPELELVEEGERRSSFFFRTDKMHKERERRRRLSEKEVTEPVNREIVDRSKQFTKELTKDMGKDIDAMREHVLTMSFPKHSAAVAGLDQAVQVIEGALGGTFEPAVVRQIQKMLDIGTTLKTLEFLSNYLDLDEQQRLLLTKKIFPEEASTSVLKLPNFEGQEPNTPGGTSVKTKGNRRAVLTEPDTRGRRSVVF